MGSNGDPPRGEWNRCPTIGLIKRFTVPWTVNQNDSVVATKFLQSHSSAAGTVDITVLDGWGGSGRWLGAQNLRGEAANYLTVDLTANAANEVDSFVIQMVDTSGVHAVWEFDVSQLVAGVPTQLASSAPMSSPHYGDNGHGGSEHYKDFNLNQVQSWQVLGEWGSPYPVDLSFDNIGISSSVTPPEYYAGHSAGAAWRGEAATRIDAVRKADLQVNVTDAAGNPLPNATVAVAMQEHEFRFGSKVPLSALNGSGSLNTTYNWTFAFLNFKINCVRSLASNR